MGRQSQTERVFSLVLERGTGTAVIDGARFELPPKEFRLLVELASEPGRAHSAEELVTSVWPDVAGMTSQDLYWHVWQLRKLIGDDKRTHKVLGNRRGFGYLINLDPDSVQLIDGPAQTASESSQEIAPSHDEDSGEESDEDDLRPVPLPDTETAYSSSHGDRSTDYARPRVSALAALVALLLSLGSGALIHSLLAPGSVERRRADPGSAANERRTQARPQWPRAKPSPKAKRGHDRRRSRSERSRRGARRHSPARVADTGPPAPSAQPPAPVAAVPAPPSSNDPAPQPQPPQPEPAPKLPPAPTRYLYHLYNTQTRDHFVTTDAGTVGQYQGLGYSGGAIARVYTAPAPNTKAISTNYGTAYVFVSATPKTDPASSVLTLWYATDNAGDFLYTTSGSEANQSGWASSVIGYVRTP